MSKTRKLGSRGLRLTVVAGTAIVLALSGCSGTSYDKPTSSPTASESTPVQEPSPTTEPTETPTPTQTATPTDEPSPSEEPTPTPTAQWSVQTSVATYKTQDDMWPTGALEGNLMLLDSGCLVVRESQGENAFIPVFPISHEKVEFDGVALTLGDKAFKVGDAITLGGSGLEWNDSYPEINYTMPAACHDLDTWWASPQQ